MWKNIYLIARHTPHFWGSAAMALITGIIFAGYPVHFSSKISANSFANQQIVAGLSSPVPTELGIPDQTQIGQKPIAFSVDCTVMPCIALTFDDGPDAINTPKVLDSLEKAHARATFFVIGNKIAGHEKILQRIQDGGSEIGNHSWSHPDFTKLRPEEMLDQINKTQSALQAAGVFPARTFRPPYGAINDQVRRTVSLPIAFWNVDPKDWHNKNPVDLMNGIEAKARPGAIIVMHDTLNETVSGLDQLINHLQSQYQLVGLSELVNIPSDAHGETMIY